MGRTDCLCPISVTATQKMYWRKPLNYAHVISLEAASCLKNKQTFQKLKGQNISFFRNKGKIANCNKRVKKEPQQKL